MSEVQAGGKGARWRGPLLAALACLGVLAFRAYQNRDVFHDRFHLPAFDGHVYAAMAEEPRVFTVAPWGYRLLTPWLVHVSPWNAACGFRRLTPAALLLAGLAAFALVRRQGHGEGPSLLAAAALLASDPVTRILRYVVLVEPMALALEVLFLLALTSGASWPVLALVGLLGTASKEFFLLLLPAVFLARLPAGRVRAALETAAVLAPSVALTLVLRFWWTPHLAREGGGLPPILDRLRSWAQGQPGSLALLLAAAVLAALGAIHPQARRWRWTFAYVAAVAFAAPFLNPSDFSAPDVPRLHVYVLPPLLPLILWALDRLWPHVGEAVPIVPTPRAAGVAASLATLALVASPFALLDRYRRVDLRGDGDAARVLATCRGTLLAAERLARGEEIVQDAVRAHADDAGEPRLRWFLREGWEPGDGAAVLASSRGVVIVPARPPRTLELGLLFADEPGPDLRLTLEGRPLATGRVDGEIRVRLPADELVRGDNLLVLERGPGGPQPQLRRLRLRPLP